MHTRLRGTRARLTAVSAMVFALASGVTAVVAVVAMTMVEFHVIDDTLRAQLPVVVNAYRHTAEATPFRGETGRTTTLPSEGPDGVNISAVVIRDGHIIARSDGAPSTTLQQAVAEPATSTPRVSDTRGLRTLVAQIGGDDATVVLGRSLAAYEATRTRAAMVLTMAVAVLTVIVAVLAYRLTGSVLRPVRRIASTAAAISERDLHRRVDIEVPPDELGDLVNTFNTMLERLEGSFAALQRFSADAAHELRTPLAQLRADVDVTLQGTRTDDKYRATLRGVGASVDRLSRVAAQLLLLARADAGRLAVDITDVDLVDLLEEVGAAWRALGAEHDVEVRVNAPESGTIRADMDLLRRLVDNLVDNAVRHSPGGAAVDVTATHGEEGWTITVADHGPGIDPDQRSRLFDRFARTRTPDDARGGAGIGLSLCAEIAALHGWTTSATAGDPGTVVTVTAPSPAIT